ncbi:hypothetical protein Nepgr_033581 [Nepenthes gracilis]|uniref:Uncharacterized protein n=1 Tax=Nepenthes gracilis TaxID=150966 RepID=A0AAD3Y6Q2_NEPGR|nr:hypothetical protein Nepgr_033581 [Nepenthes gracilis]
MSAHLIDFGPILTTYAKCSSGLVGDVYENDEAHSGSMSDKFANVDTNSEHPELDEFFFFAFGESPWAAYRSSFERFVSNPTTSADDEGGNRELALSLPEEEQSLSSFNLDSTKLLSEQANNRVIGGHHPPRKERRRHPRSLEYRTPSPSSLVHLRQSNFSFAPELDEGAQNVADHAAGSNGVANSVVIGPIPGVDDSTPESITRIIRKYSLAEVVDVSLIKAPSEFPDVSSCPLPGCPVEDYEDSMAGAVMPCILERGLVHTLPISPPKPEHCDLVAISQGMWLQMELSCGVFCGLCLFLKLL